MAIVEVHPVQVHRGVRGAFINTDVTRSAYEVYCHLYGPQPAMMEGNCRGGFGVGELIAFLYAKNFPKQEWSARVDEAFRGMKGL